MDTQVSSKLQRFFEQYPLKRYEKDELLIFAGDEPQGVFYLVSGQVQQYDVNPKGGEIIVNIFKPHAFFPMSWAIHKTPNLYFFEASERSDVRIAPPQDVLDFLQANGDVTYDLLGRVYLGTVGMQRRMAHIMGGNSRSRVLFELLLECKRFGKQNPDGSYNLEMHEDEIAKIAGLSRETANREIKKLKSAGLLTITHKEIIIHSLPRIVEELGDNL